MTNDAPALAKYTHHLSSCARRGTTAEDCTCGLQEAWIAYEAAREGVPVTPTGLERKVAETVADAYDRALDPHDAAHEILEVCREHYENEMNGFRHEANFWEKRYDLQHKQIHNLGDQLAAEREAREKAEADLDLHKQAGARATELAEQRRVWLEKAEAERDHARRRWDEEKRLAEAVSYDLNAAEKRCAELEEVLGAALGYITHDADVGDAPAIRICGMARAALSTEGGTEDG